MSNYELLSYQQDNKIATITLHNGKVNAFSPQLIAEFNQALDQAEADTAVVIFTGQPGILSGGYDLKVMKSGPENAIKLITAGSQLARRLLSFPTPVIAACTGHAVAKGAFMLLASDVRIGVSGDFKIGLNEVNIGMTMHYTGIELARARLPDSWYNRSVLCAEMFDPDTAMSAGFLDKVVPPEHLMATANAIATQFVEHMDMTAHKQTKLKSREAFLQTLDDAIERDKQQVVNL